MRRKRCLSVLVSLALIAGLCSAGTGGAKVYAQEPEAVSGEVTAGETEDVSGNDEVVVPEKPEIPSDETGEPETGDGSETGNQSTGSETIEKPEEDIPDNEEAETGAPDPAGAGDDEAYEEPETQRKKAVWTSNGLKERIAVGATVQIDPNEYDFWSESGTFSVANPEIASVDATGNLTGRRIGTTSLRITDAEGEWVEIPVEVVTPVTISKTTYNVYYNLNEAPAVVGWWSPYSYPTVKVSVKGANSETVAKFENTDGISPVDKDISKGYFELEVSKSGTITVTIDGKVFIIRINYYKAEVSASNTISKNLKSLVTYKGKKDTLILKLNGKKKAPKSWKSMNTAVATVNKSGQVTGKKMGRVYIRAYLDDGSYIKYLVECTYKGAYQAVNNAFHDYESGDGKGYKVIKYSQPKRMNKGYRDCSSFVSRCYYDTTLGRKIYKIGGIGGNYAATAAGQAKWLKSKDKTVANKIVSESKLLPGDTMYTKGPTKNGEWRDIYHAFLYVGNGHVLTTYNSNGKEKTLSLQPYSYDGYNVVYIGRPLMTPVKTKSVSLNRKSVTLGVKEKFTLKATKKPSNSSQGVSFSSSNKSVAAVSSKGVITARKKGTAYITVKSGDASKKCKVTVKAAPKKIKLNAKKKTLKVKQTFQIKQTVTKGTASNKITYQSSNPKVAGVSSKGKITAKKAGTASVTVTTFNKKKAVVKITVK